MKRLIFAALALGLAACGAEPSNVMQGYGEADYLYLASQESGVVADLFVREGDVVEAGAPVFRLDPDRLRLQAQTAGAQQSALSQAVQAARAQAELARANYQRSTELYQRGFLPRARLDSDRAARDAANASLDQAVRELSAAGASTGLATTRLNDLNGAAPAAGTIEQIYHRPGEVVAAGAPIASLLTPQNMKVRFFAPEPLLTQLPVGALVRVSCDGCPDNLTARVSYVAAEPQFTPPVIYSLERREKLVFLVEARFDAATPVRPGMPVDVRPQPQS
ncbi:MAG: efflux RND transporter periplasmic adaptor subunit [Hyphomonadaceae bacterium]|nr:efflux RND transporter periplasmic adaptor subunit [Hyphomonadaceae bacterium]